MLICDLPCDECGDTTQVKFAQVYVNFLVGGDILSAHCAIYCPEHNADREDTHLLKEASD